MLIHGGAGNISSINITDSAQQIYREKLEEALNAGYTVLDSGGSSTDAVITAICILENSGIFNAGKGAVYNAEGKFELDASLMEGKTSKAGAIAGISDVKNPILVAQAVMNKTKHVFLTGQGLQKFAKDNGFENVDEKYFWNPTKMEKYKKQKDNNAEVNDKKGTVGAVAIDRYGNLAAGTSTGGVSMKMYGRVGDSPVIGAGTYADNRSCAVSCTGTGEYFIRTVAAHSVAALMEYGGVTLKKACDIVINEKIAGLGGDGGLIAIDKDGNFEMVFNTKGMFRGYKNSRGKVYVAMFKEN